MATVLGPSPSLKFVDMLSTPQLHRFTIIFQVIAPTFRAVIATHCQR